MERASQFSLPGGCGEWGRRWKVWRQMRSSLANLSLISSSFAWRKNGGWEGGVIYGKVDEGCGNGNFHPSVNRRKIIGKGTCSWHSEKCRTFRFQDYAYMLSWISRTPHFYHACPLVFREAFYTAYMSLIHCMPCALDIFCPHHIIKCKRPPSMPDFVLSTQSGGKQRKSSTSS